MTLIIDGISIAKKIHTHTAERVRRLKEKGITPTLAVVLVGDDKPSKVYVEKKGKAAEEAGMNFCLFTYPNTISQQALEQEILRIQNEEHISGLIIQLPIPENFYPTLLDVVHERYDVDCLTHTNLGKLVMNTNDIVPPTPGAVMAILQELEIDLKGKTVVIVGSGVLVGKPLAVMMMNREATVITCNAFTRDIKKYTKEADIIVSGVGKKNIITGDMVREGQIIVDAGVNFEDNHMFGDVDFDHVAPLVAAITPIPGGVGPITVAQLLYNTVVLAEKYDANQQINTNITNPTNQQMPEQIYDANQQINTNITNSTNQQITETEDKLIYPELSYTLTGIFFDIHNELGKYCNEKQVCDALEKKLQEQNMHYEREKILPPSFEGEKKGRNRVDFVIEDKVIVEIKTKTFLEKEDYYQLQRYLHAYDKKLGLLVNFRDERIKPKRILNSNTAPQHSP